eukprot:SAG25_NODE_3213_length_1170_cov_10.015760_1_plen_49_part_10
MNKCLRLDHVTTRVIVTNNIGHNIFITYSSATVATAAPRYMHESLTKQT